LEEARQHSAVTAPLNPGELAAAVRSHPYWYHKIQLPGGVVTPGWAPIDPDKYGIPTDLTGKRVLDIGAWDGYWTFEALKRGAREAVAIDDFSDLLGKSGPSSRQAWRTFDLCRSALGWPESRCNRIEMSVYDISEKRLGRFDVVFFFGTLYHLRHPLLALDLIGSVTDELLCVESAILDDLSPYRGGLGHGYGDQMVMEFYPGDQYGRNHTNWWVPTLVLMGHMVGAAGFKDIDIWKLEEKPMAEPRCRGFARGWKKGRPAVTPRVNRSAEPARP
jgi:tRNA (mo5U34)-methyltransferase